MKKTVLKNATLLMAILFISASVFAQGGNKKQQKKKNKGTPYLKIPDLTSEQESKLKKMHIAFQKDMLPLKNELGEKKARLKTVSTGDNVKMNEVYAVLENISAIKLNLAKKQASHRQEVRQQLNEDQQVWFDTHAPLHKNGMKKQRHKRKHGKQKCQNG